MRLIAFICLLTMVGCARTQQVQHSLDADRYRVAETALRYLMDAHSNHGTERNYYSAYVIGEGEFTSQLLSAFADYKPPVAIDIQTETRNGGTVDKATGKPVKLWSVSVEKIRGDLATAGVTWHSGMLAAGGHTLHLRRKNGRWFVESEKMNWVS